MDEKVRDGEVWFNREVFLSPLHTFYLHSPLFSPASVAPVIMTGSFPLAHGYCLLSGIEK